ncbi:hypothetical protein Gotur_032323, partial [Gossypium turneri]
MSNAWNQTRRMKKLVMGPMTTHEYNEWWVKRINDNIPKTRNEALEKSLSENQKEKGELKDRVAELERSFRQYRNQNCAIELRDSLSRIEEMKKRIEELEMALQHCEIQIEYLEANEDRNNEQLHYFQNQVRNRGRSRGS